MSDIKFECKKISEDEVFARLAKIPNNGEGFFRFVNQKEVSFFCGNAIPEKREDVFLYEFGWYDKNKSSIMVRQVDDYESEMISWGVNIL